MPGEETKPLVAVVGPTGSGKSSLALRLAEHFDGEIVNFDSLQMYRGFNIGTAKVGEDERRGIPHHLVDAAAPEETVTAGEYARRARAVLAGIGARGRLPVLVGGTGFYLKALLDGLAPGPQRDTALRTRLEGIERRRRGGLHRILRRIDPATASRIHANDVQKLVRAVEICLLARRPAALVFEAGRDRLQGWTALKLGLNPERQELYDRLDQRTAGMFQTGLVEEVRGLLDLGVPAGAKPFESIGYRQALSVVRGELTLEQAVASTQLATRQYAKRQWTWFRRDSEVQWLQGFGEDPAIVDAGIYATHSFIKLFSKIKAGWTEHRPI
ncbi:MAG: tRNA (adenosine(37)-N6)-dimethylallyltransferase MiaA [Bryobacteraceae bacterium]|nr:tRNA (adenosine(37)-N6)-dimethylallyltransferase MiaA [Bryobacteraceae bacterium]